jgi:hypothetical protein|tara:strand:- start:497 stop:664 length:168 start_codon:yes stop_codon:yes gene_type:complete
MHRSKEDKKFNDTLKRMMDAKPKPHEEMKKGRAVRLEPKPMRKLPPAPDGLSGPN